MAKFQLITLRYSGKDRTIIMYGRGEDLKKYEFKITGFQPYFYVPEEVNIESNPLHVSTELGYKTIFGQPVAKLVATDPLAVEKWRQSFSEYYEADIKFVRRFLIDSGVRNGFEIPDGLTTVFWQDVKPSNFILPDLICVTLDIEVKTNWRFPDPNHANEMVSCVTVHDNKRNKYVTLIVDPRDRPENWAPDHVVIYCPTEVNLFERLKSYLDFIAGDVIRGWNIFFDLDYLRARGRNVGVYIADAIDKYSHFDQLEGYRKIFRKSGNQLKDVVVAEGLAQPEDVIYEGRLLYDENRDLFIRYSHHDVMFCVQIDDKHHHNRFFWRSKIFSGLENYASCMYQSTKVDALFLRYAHNEAHYVLPSKHYEEHDNDEDDEAGYKGALVLDPRIGITEGIGVFDMSKFFPSIIMAWHLSPERNDGKGIYQAVITELMNLRIEFDKEMKRVVLEYGKKSPEYASIKDQRQVVKDNLNSVYGYAGEPGSRLYLKEMAAKITEVSRDVVNFLRENIQAHFGFLVIYGDTDSIMVQCPQDRCEEVQNYANEILKTYCTDRGVEPLLEINYEKYMRNIMFVEHKGGEGRAAKKYYSGNVIFEDDLPCDYIMVKGHDRGGGTSHEGRKVFKQVDEMILRGQKDQVPAVIKEVIGKMKHGEYRPNQVAVNVGLSTDPEKYKTVDKDGRPKSPPNYVRGALYSNKFLNLDIRGNDKIKMFFVRKVPGFPPTDILCVLDEEQIPEGTVIDWNEQIRATLRLKLESILKVAGIHWEDCTGARSLVTNYSE